MEGSTILNEEVDAGEDIGGRDFWKGLGEEEVDTRLIRGIESEEAAFRSEFRMFKRIFLAVFAQFLLLLVAPSIMH